MKKIASIFTVVIMLTGCPGGKPAPQARYTYINDEKLCFSVDKNDVLNYYRIESIQETGYTVIKNDEGLYLKYPDNCIDVKWKDGYSYVISYGLNDKRYIHRFFIDNNGQLTNTDY
ncbi:hypothetical protein F3J27_18970 [Enterobacter sp. Ap-916]|uniref:putative T6SS immunity periplasmic lipoprotein n=1 Tax=unclassified Enterobacter TaxID=2608935 RepID=UPI001423E8DD|nr:MULTISPECIES: putative T6SS immunity periplasmic lipoprotein [unclassified Enterobacter]NIF60158.1 hypothetical protein [Enterobacter sp. Ap-867]NIG31565.1 hypothetical protein [Enterobacter sp. Ap-916]